MEIPTFPKFKKIEYSDKTAFEAISNRFPCYSDFNFNSFYSWNLDGRHAISQLHNNLILKFSDYETNDPFFTFIGEYKVYQTVNELFALSKKQNIEQKLKLIPEVVIQNLSSNDFTVEEDPKNCDYIFSVEELSELKGKRFKNKRQIANKCAQQNQLEIIDASANPDGMNLVFSLIESWKKIKLNLGKVTNLESEETAAIRVLEHCSTQESLQLTFIYCNNKLAGFSIDELLPYGYVLSHHCKTLPNFTGLSEYFNQQLAIKLLQQGGKYWNWEQDLGTEVLQKMKDGYRPIHKQKKFIVTP